MAGIFHKGIRYGGFGNLWGMIKGNIASQTDLKEALDSKTEKDRYIVRQVTASAGTQIYIPASGTDSRIKTTGCEIKVVSQKKSDGTPYKFKSVQIYDGYAIITLGEALSGVYMGVKVTENGYNVNDLVPMEYEEAQAVGNLSKYSGMGGTLAIAVCKKKGGVVNLAGRITGLSNTNAWQAFFQVPEGFRPPYNIYINFSMDIVNIGYVPTMGQVTTDGKVEGYWSAQEKVNSVYFACSYHI